MTKTAENRPLFSFLPNALSSTFALFGTHRTPCFPGFPRKAARVFENPRGITGVQKVEIAEISRFFWAMGLRERAKVELRTVREACASYGSSLHKRPSRDAAALATAFTIRARSRRTVRQTFFPSRECQSGARPGAAPASISAADISACLPESVSRGPLVTEDPREVSPLSW